MHPWYSRINDFETCQKRDDILYEEKCGLNFPDFIVFDLDPYIYSGQERKGQEPEYNTKGFRAAVEVAYLLKDLFDELRIESFIKTSGKTGLHIFAPIVNLYTYEQTRSFAEVIGEILLRRYPKKITMEWDTTKRKDKVFFDHNQNARGKTIASVFSARPTESATVSMPIRWDNLSNVFPTDYTILYRIFTQPTLSLSLAIRLQSSMVAARVATISDVIKDLGIISCDSCEGKLASFDVYVESGIANVPFLKRFCSDCIQNITC